MENAVGVDFDRNGRKSVCRIACAEAHAALSRLAREVPEDAPGIEQAKQALASEWPYYVVMEVTQAGDYADTFALRGYDSVQLAAAYEAGRIAQTPVCFACFDTRLNKAAKVLGMDCLWWRPKRIPQRPDAA